MDDTTYQTTQIKSTIEQAVAPLLGLPLSIQRRAADLQGFHFGEIRETTAWRGGVAYVGEYALHIQCTWRIAGPHGIVVGRRDLYCPASDHPEVDLMEFDYNGPVPNRRDERLSLFMEAHTSRSLTVTGISADELGGLRVALTEGFVLEVFPDDSDPGEHWRFFRPTGEEAHFVVTGRGIEA